MTKLCNNVNRVHNRLYSPNKIRYCFPIYEYLFELESTSINIYIDVVYIKERIQ